MNLFTVLIMGIVEGITEFLPISSTGHLILTSRLLAIPQTEFLKSFEITIQLGAILSVVVLYWRLLATDLKALKRVAVAFVPTGVIGLIFYHVVKSFLLGNSSVVIWSLFFGGIFIIIFELFYRQKNDSVSDISSITYPQALLIGVFQSIAIIPGVSRAAATIIGGLFLGLKRKAIVEFSFILAVPTMLAATGLDLLKNSSSFSSGQFGYLAVGFLVSFIVAILSIKFLLVFIKNHNFIPFGAYRIILALLAFWLIK